MKTVKMTFQDGKILVDQDYEFVVSDEIYFSSDLTPYKEVKFRWNLDLQEMIEDAPEKEEELLQQVADKLKQDFISFMRKKSDLLKEANYA